jgi:muconolactone D-isomerase
MALYLIRMQTNLPGDWPAEKTAQLRATELDLGAKYMEQGLIRRIFRTVGEDGNASIWEAETPEQLQEALRALPKFPWAKIVVTPLIQHPIEKLIKDRRGEVPNF